MDKTSDVAYWTQKCGRNDTNMNHGYFLDWHNCGGVRKQDRKGKGNSTNHSPGSTSTHIYLFNFSFQIYLKKSYTLEKIKNCELGYSIVLSLKNI